LGKNGREPSKPFNFYGEKRQEKTKGNLADHGVRRLSHGEDNPVLLLWDGGKNRGEADIASMGNEEKCPDGWGGGTLHLFSTWENFLDTREEKGKAFLGLVRGGGWVLASG